jgi:hypothetical protein
MPTISSSGLRGATIAAAIVFALTAVATTGAIKLSGRQIVDVDVYRSYGDAMESGLVPYRDFAVEYPPGALPVFLAPSLVTSSPDEQHRAFVVLMALIGAAGVALTSASLCRLGRSPRTVRTILAVLAVSPVVLGGVLLTRFDLVPATIVAAATSLLLAGRHRWAAVALGAAAAVKLYPLVLLPLLAAWVIRRRGRREGTIAIGLALGVLALAYLPFLLLSPSGVWTSVWQQAERPLQLETVGAGVLLVLHATTGLSVTVESSYGSQNIGGTTAAVVAGVQSLFLAAALVWLWVRFARGRASAERLVRYLAATLLVLIALGKVFSPQFLVWPLLAVPLVAGRRGLQAAWLYGFAVVSTAIWFPAFYGDLQDELDPGISTLLVLRGVALLGAVGVLLWGSRVELTRARARAGPAARSHGLSPGRR